MSKLLHSRASYCAAGPSRSQAHGRPWFLIPIPQILSPKEPPFLLSADGDYLSTVRVKPEAVQGAQTGGFSLQTLTVSALIAGKLSSNA